MIKLDCTQHTIVIVCTGCGLAWRGFAFDKLDAWTRATTHEKLVHPGEVQAQNALAKHLERTRHAE